MHFHGHLTAELFINIFLALCGHVSVSTGIPVCVRRVPGIDREAAETVLIWESTAESRPSGWRTGSTEVFLAFC